MKKVTELKYWLPLPIILVLYIALKGNGQLPTLLILRLVLLAVGYGAAKIDWQEKRVPNRLVAGFALAWFFILAPLVLYDPDAAISIGISGSIGFVIAGAVLLVVYIVSRKGLGGGDVKLMSVASLYLGYDGALSALLYGSVLSAVTAIVLILIKKMTPKDSIPLVPFLYIGILITEFLR